MTSLRRTAVLLAFAGAVLLGVAACGPTGAGPAGGGAAGAEVPAAELAAEAGVLAAVGFDSGLARAEPAPGAEPEPSAEPAGDRAGKWRKRQGARVWLRRDTLHGEAVVQTKDGSKTVVVQRGKVTAISDTSVTVKSSDGFTLTWTFGDKLHVVEHRTKIAAEAISSGDEIGVAGRRDGDKTVARLIVKR
jgi:hypothetical protein